MSVDCITVFFSSRRRHTRLVSDWSSDVCSSDLPAGRPDVMRTFRSARQAARTWCGPSGPPGRPPGRRADLQVRPAGRPDVVRTFRSAGQRSEEHTSELQSLTNLVCRLLLEKKNTNTLIGQTPERVV